MLMNKHSTASNNNTNGGNDENHHHHHHHHLELNPFYARLITYPTTNLLLPHFT